MPVRDWPQPEQRLFYLYARWRLGHAEFRAFGPHNWKHRPHSLPKYVPLRWRQEFDRIFKPPPPPPPPPPVQHRSPFAGRGMLLAWDPLSALRLAGLLDWVAPQAEGRNEDGSPWTTPEIVARLKGAFPLVHVWEAAVSEGGAAVTRLGANGGYIGQAEGQPQHNACLGLPPMSCPKAIVSNVTYLPDAPNAWPQAWACLPEAYANANPRATPENMNYEAYKRGAREIFLCFGLYDASAEQPGVGKRIPLRSYLDVAQPKGLIQQGWNGYLSETMSPDDDAALAGR